jgi:Zn finger protein HypA/HybF involved in hydrogenase expression
MSPRALPKLDGFGPAERKAVHSAVRLVWQRSLARRLAVKRATDAEGYIRCEQCLERTPKHHVDHIENVGEVGGPDYIQRMFVPSDQLRVLCRTCHAPKTKLERRKRKKAA